MGDIKETKWILSGIKPEDFMMSREKKYKDAVDDSGKPFRAYPTSGECSEWWGVQKSIMSVFVVRVEFGGNKAPLLASFPWEKEARDYAIGILNTTIFDNIENVTIQECPVYSTVEKGEGGYWHLVKEEYEDDLDKKGGK